MMNVVIRYEELSTYRWWKVASCITKSVSLIWPAIYQYQLSHCIHQIGLIVLFCFIFFSIEAALLFVLQHCQGFLLVQNEQQQAPVY